MRVLMTVDAIDDVFTYVLDLARGLAEHNVDVVVAAPGAPLGESQRRELSALSNVVLEERYLAAHHRHDLWHDREIVAEWLVQLAARYRANVVHLNHVTCGDAGFDVPVLTTVHACMLSWFEQLLRYVGPHEFTRYERIVRQSLTASDVVVTATASMATSVRRLYGPISSVATVYHARPPRPLWPAQKEPLVLTAGGQEDAAHSVIRVASSLPWRVVIAAVHDGVPLVADVHPEQAPIIDATTVHCTGQLSSRELAGWYQRARIFALPTREETSGLAALEAAQAGCVLVLGDTPSMRELWQGAACFVPPGDSARLRRVLLGIINDERRYAALARASRRRAAAFSYDHFVREYVLAYRTMQGGFCSLFDGLRLAQTG